jgi:hypothetical protein
MTKGSLTIYRKDYSTTMNTLTINSKAALTLARATEKARTEKPLVKKTRNYGWYLVRSTTDMTRWYSVICNSVTREITCNCPATKPCYHIAAVAPLHSFIARQLRDQAAQELVVAEAEAANWPLPGLTEVPSFFNSEAEAERVATEAALVALEVAWPVSEIEEFIAENSTSLDRHCPTCGLVQPDNDNTDCWACGAALNLDDLDPMLCECGKPGFSFFNRRWNCWPCVKDQAGDEAAKDEVRALRDFTPALEVKCAIRRCPALADADCNGLCSDCYRDEMQTADDRACLFG